MRRGKVAHLSPRIECARPLERRARLLAVRQEVRLRTRPRNAHVIEFYNGRGTAERRIKEGKNALKWTRLSCRRFKDNQVRLQLFALAYNLANSLRQPALPRSVQTWSLTTPREKLIEIGAKVVHHARAVTFQLGEVAVPRALFAAILERINRLRLVPGTG